jgi:hypothetical protein
MVPGFLLEDLIRLRLIARFLELGVGVNASDDGVEAIAGKARAKCRSGASAMPSGNILRVM